MLHNRRRLATVLQHQGRNAPIRAAIVGDDIGIRESLSRLIPPQNDVRWIGTWTSLNEAARALRSNPADVLLVHLEASGLSGARGIAQLKECHPALLIVAISKYDDDAHIAQALDAGVCGHLLDHTPPSLLLQAIQEVFDGGAPLSPTVARRLLEMCQRQRRASLDNHQLSPHQVRLLRLFVDGCDYRSAAAKMGVTVNTIAFHVRQIYTKLQVHSKSEAVAQAFLKGIVSL